MHYDFNKAINTGNSQKLLSADILSYKRILVVDDSITSRTMIKNILMNSGYNVDVCTDVEEALVKLKLIHYDLIITDLNMPKIDGYEFVKKIKNDEMYADIPVIVMSSVAEEEALKDLAQYNIDFYMCKENFDQDVFSNQVRELLTKYHN